MDTLRRFLVLIAIVLSTLAVSGDGAAKKKEPTMSLSERIQMLNDLSSRRSIIRLNGEKFKNLVGSKSMPRNYSIVVMMTALSSHRQCSICRAAYEEYQIVANSFKFQDPNNKYLYFAMVDYDEGSDIFNILSINSAPVFIYFSDRNNKIKTADQMDIQRIGFGAETIARWIQEKSDVAIRVIRPPNYLGTLAILLLVAVIGSLLYMRRNNLDFLYNKTSWAMGAMTIVFTMTSGQMWNHIRGPPAMQRTAKGGVHYIHGSSSGQFIVETYIIFFLNAVITLGMIVMNDAMKGRGDPKKRKIMAMIGLGMVALFFSLMLSIFRSKAHGYPYSFLFK